jgi:hypothetical protein
MIFFILCYSNKYTRMSFISRLFSVCCYLPEAEYPDLHADADQISQVMTLVQDDMDELVCEGFVRCPRCGAGYEIIEVRCGVIRCGMTRQGSLNPHTTEATIKIMLERGVIIDGCGAPLEFVDDALVVRKDDQGRLLYD